MAKNMKTVATNNSNSKDPQVDLEFLLRTNGFLFPETVNEVNAYERTFGDTDIILPDDMQEPSFLKEARSRVTRERDNIISLRADNFSLAARAEKGNELPEHIKQQMEKDLAKLKR
ncbi:hypothetical protein [Mucilaginibacter endophyticus]|uniref:hypothetical protein n=1 Tax=Mucilaginibacter endophyticus TaxID=2675003 RepID=UPI000E0D622D|nr:hypothetical protein [Mucilaginibacter endophyticus]